MHSLGQHFIVGFDGTKVTPRIKTLIQKYQIGGFILFKRNIESPRQVHGLISRLQALSDIPLFIGVDQEGGEVFRLGPPFTQIPPMASIGHAVSRHKQTQVPFQVGVLLAKELKAVGFNWNYVPVVDVHSNPKNPVIGTRSFGPDPILVGRCAQGMILGLHSEGVLSCAKHFPGHGATSLDSHKALPVVKASKKLLWKRDIYPYRKLISKNLLSSIMTAHVMYPHFDPHYCATLSHEILTGILRKKLGYKNLIVSDDLFMKAISNHYELACASELFFKAGGDLALICQNPEIQIQTIEQMKKKVQADALLKKLLERSFLRIKKTKNKFCKDIASFDGLMIGCVDHQRIVKRINVTLQ